MNTLIVVVLILTSLTIVADVLLLFFWAFNFHTYSSKASESKVLHHELQAIPKPLLEEVPHVAVLLAVRNEEVLLPSCLEHLLASDYLSFSIWIGNDDSEDNTLKVAKDFSKKDPRVKVINITKKVGQAKAKANVIAQLVAAANSSEEAPDLLLVTDADVQVQPYWMRGMVQSWQAKPKTKEIGVVTGITLVDGKSSWGELQRIDWLFALGMVKVASDWGMPIATMGNNMMMYRPAYYASGGYEKLPFSITEDFQILHEITGKGFSFRNVVDSKVIAFTQPMRTWQELLQQRRRWMHGAIRLPLSIVSILFLQALFFPLILFLLFAHPLLGVGMWLSKVALQSIFIMQVERKLKLSKKFRSRLARYLFLYELYAGILTILTIVIYLLPLKTSWKGRQY